MEKINVADVCEGDEIIVNGNRPKIVADITDHDDNESILVTFVGDDHANRIHHTKMVDWVAYHPFN